MADANITIEDGVDAKIIHVSGQLDESNVDEKIKEVYKVVEASPKNLHLIFDLENLDYLNSKAIGYLTDLYGKVTGDGGKSPQPRPRQIFWTFFKSSALPN